jgi:hypothetical protein
MSALPLKADIPRRHHDVSFGPLDGVIGQAVMQGKVKHHEGSA